MGLKQSHSLACPGCGQDDDLVILMWGWYHITNTDPQGDDYETDIEEAKGCGGPYNFDGTSPAHCWVCGWEGSVKDCAAAAAGS